MVHQLGRGGKNALAPRPHSRRKFLGYAAALGTGSALPLPSLAQQDRTRTLTCQMQIFEIDDPRLFDQSEKGNIVRGTLENLVRYTQDFKLVPWLLRSWDISEDGLNITLNLREDVTWSNGDAFTSEDVAFNIKRWCDHSVPGNSMANRMSILVDPATGSLREGAMRVLDAHTVLLTLPRPDITLIAGLSDYPAMIVHRSFDDTGANFPQNPIGTGPYAFKSYQPGASAILERRADWWGGQVAIEHIVYTDLGLDPADFVEKFNVGKIDMVYDSTGVFVELFDAQYLVRQEVLSGATLVFRVNRSVVADDHPYRDPRVRRALAMAIDNAVILELGYSDLGAVAGNTHVGPMNDDYVPTSLPKPNPEAALKLLREADAHRMEHELISLDDDWNRDSADAVAAQLRDAGIKVTRRILPAQDYWANWQSHPFSCTAWNMRPLGLQIMRLAYASDGVWNETGFAEPVFDALLAKAEGELDAAARAPLMTELADWLIKDGTIIQPYWRKLVLHHNVRVTGARRHPTNEHHHDLWGLLT